MIADQELNLLAAYMVDLHGDLALHYADCAVAELEQVGAQDRAEAWRLLREVVMGMMAGRINRDGHTVH